VKRTILETEDAVWLANSIIYFALWGPGRGDPRAVIRAAELSEKLGIGRIFLAGLRDLQKTEIVKAPMN
jgi:hypothetical protein